MSDRTSIALLFAAPLVLLGILLAWGLTVPVPYLGRGYVIKIDLASSDEQGNLPDIIGTDDGSRPLVVIDAGHGGHDPGAVSGGLREKQIVLGLAKALRDELVNEGGLRVAMTREDDKFLALAERVNVARELGADLFISIHADSAGDFDNVSGASIYTLSDEASSEAAARFADRENRADRINGLDLSGENEEVGAILVELSQRRTSAESSEFASLIVREGTGVLGFHSQARRSAELGVLRAPDIPSVLFEAGFITNPDEARRLTSEVGKQRFAQVIGRSIRIYLATNSEN